MVLAVWAVLKMDVFLLAGKGRIGGLDWFGLVWIGLDWFGLVWIGLDWFGLVVGGFDFVLLGGKLFCRGFLDGHLLGLPF